MKYPSLAVLVCVVTAGSLISVGVASQSPTPKASPKNPATIQPWTPPLTPDGHPDLQGIWLNNRATPLERPKALEGRLFLTDAEVAELKQRADRIFAGSDSDQPLGDNLFLAALANLEQYRSATGPNRSAVSMHPREFDNRTSLVVDPPDGKIPPMTPEARERRTAAAARELAAARAEDLSLSVRCITYGVPRMGPAGTGDPVNGYYQILQSPGYIVLLMEVFHDARIISLDGSSHLSNSIRQWHGDSRGRWEGNTLVIDTTNFSAKSNFLGSAENLHMVERITRTAPDMIDYEVTLADPTTWSTPWTALIRLTQMKTKIYEYACHEGNRAMDGILAGARAEEKAVEEAAKGRK
jgi:hypothetical protein